MSGYFDPANAFVGIDEVLVGHNVDLIAVIHNINFILLRYANVNLCWTSLRTPVY